MKEVAICIEKSKIEELIICNRRSNEIARLWGIKEKHIHYPNTIKNLIFDKIKDYLVFKEDQTVNVNYSIDLFMHFRLRDYICNIIDSNIIETICFTILIEGLNIIKIKE